MDDYIWKMRGASFLRSLRVAVEELQRNTSILKNETAMKRDAVDPSSASLKKCFEPIHDSLWSYCQHGVDPRVLERIFGSKPEPQEVKAYRVAHTRYLKLKNYVLAVEDYCRAGQERFPVAASKYEFIRLQIIEKLESPPEWASLKYHEQIKGIKDALRDISILTIGDVLKAVGSADTIAKSAGEKVSRRKHDKCTSRFAGRTIRNLFVATDGITFTVCRDYTYKITAKQAIEFLDKLIESYEKTNQPVKAEFQVAAVFKRGDAMRFKKRFMVCKNGSVHLNIPC